MKLYQINKTETKLKHLLKKLNETEDLNQKMDLLDKIKSIDININFYKNMIAIKK